MVIRGLILVIFSLLATCSAWLSPVPHKYSSQYLLKNSKFSYDRVKLIPDAIHAQKTIIDNHYASAGYRGRSCSSAFRKLTALRMAQGTIDMPALSSTMTEGKIIAWTKRIGDKISPGDVVLVVASDKADMDVEAYEEGFLASILVQEGESANVGAPVALLAKSTEELELIKLGKAPSSSQSPASDPQSSPTTTRVKYERVIMPALSSTMTEGKVLSWSKKVGDKVNVGDILFVAESDKADMDVEAYEEGYLAAILASDGQVISVGSPVAYLVKSPEEIVMVKESINSIGSVKLVNDDAHLTNDHKQDTQTVSNTSAGRPTAGRIAASGYAKKLASEMGIDLQSVTPSRPDGYITSSDLPKSSKAHTPSEGVINATPMARKYASENKIDLSKIKGTGNFGRVTSDDVLFAAGKIKSPIPAKAIIPPSPSSSQLSDVSVKDPSTSPRGVVPMDNMQRAVAKNMEKTLSVPVFRVSREIFTDKFDELYSQLKPKGVTVSALLAKAVSETLKKHPLLNAAYEDGSIKYNEDINIAMAVAVDGGLITPTIIKSQSMDLFSISRVWKELVAKAKAKKLSPAEYSSGTFTISNLGMFGVSQFDAILPPGTGSILAVSSSSQKLVPSKTGQGVEAKKCMMVTVTCDHRHIYGAHAAEFLKDLAGE